MLDRTIELDIERTDGELVKLYQRERDQSALNELVTRYLPTINRRMRSLLNNDSDADELCQDVFVKLLNKIDTYSDDGRFHHYLNRIATNTFLDWLKKNRPETFAYDEDFDERFVGSEYDYSTPDSEATGTEKWDYFARKCIPQLPPKERLVFLFLQESMLWDANANLEWSHIAELNGVDRDTAWSRFESARELLMKNTALDNIDPEELLIFVLWTEVNRPIKKGRTLKYLANLLGEQPQNLQNRSFQAKKKLKQYLAAYEG